MLLESCGPFVGLNRQCMFGECLESQSVALEATLEGWKSSQPRVNNVLS
jgi:hypothetical protein